MRSRLYRARRLLLVGVALSSMLVGLLAYGLDILRRPELDTVDARFSVRGDQRPPGDIVLVEIDEQTFADLQRSWPFPRSLHARVIDRLRRAGAQVIGYDVQISEPTDLGGLVADPANRKLFTQLSDDEDEALLQAERRARGRVVLATTAVSEDGAPNVLFGEDGLKFAGARAGTTLLPRDPGGVLRRLPYEVDGLKTFAVVVVETDRGRRVARSAFDGDDAWIDYRGPPGTFRRVRYSDVLRGRAPADLFRGKIVIVGAAAPSLQDRHATPTGEGMAGAEVQANAIATVRGGLPLGSAPGILTVAFIAGMAIVPPAASMRLRWGWALAVIGGVGIAYTIATQLAFNSGTVMSFLYPMGTLTLASVGALSIHALTAAFEREHTRDVFTRFVPEQVVDEALLAAQADLRLPGVRHEGTVVFIDLRDFTSFSESLPPERVIDVLNRYFEEMSGAILQQEGTLVAYIGDGILALFGAPLPQDDHADRAVAATREMLRRMDRFNSWLRFEALSDGFELGIGVNSGYLMSGNVGSEQRIEYTTVGDTANTAARLERMTKGTAHQVFISETTRSFLKRPAADLVYVDTLDVRGRQGRVKVWTLLDDKGQDLDRGRADG